MSAAKRESEESEAVASAGDRRASWEEKRRCLLRQELELEGLWARLGANEEAFATVLLADLLYALKLPRHERSLPAYGSIIWPEGEVDADEQIKPSSLAEARALVNGTSSFNRRGRDGELTVECFERRRDRELEMVLLSEACRGTIVQRTPSGVVKVCTRRDVVVYEQGVWYAKPYGVLAGRQAPGVGAAQCGHRTRHGAGHGAGRGGPLSSLALHGAAREPTPASRARPTDPAPTRTRSGCRGRRTRTEGRACPRG